jgi:hypothetical protein
VCSATHSTGLSVTSAMAVLLPDVSPAFSPDRLHRFGPSVPPTPPLPARQRPSVVSGTLCP